MLVLSRRFSLHLLAALALAMLVPLGLLAQNDGGGRPDRGSNGGGRPGNPGGNRPGNPGGNRPGNPGGNRPGNPGGNRPGNPGGNRPGNPGGNRPGNPGGNRPGNPGGNRPGDPGGHRPGGNRPPQWGRPPQQRPSYSFRPNDRAYLLRHYRNHLRSIQRARRPRLIIGGFFPYGDIGYLSPLPPTLYGYLPPPPPGYQMGYFDGYVVVYDPITYFIANVIDLL
jgi:hypothetical protein